MLTPLQIGKFLLQDIAATLFFLALYLLTHNVPLSVVLGIAVGVGQVIWQKMRRGPIGTLQWVSLFLMVLSGAATLITSDPRFVMVKTSIVYLIGGTPMLERGWLNRYMPQRALDLLPDLIEIFGFVWAGLMFFSAALNLLIAFRFSIAFWGSFMAIYGIAGNLGLFLFQYAVMRHVGRRRRMFLAV
jgi:intracellular septation protein A